MRVGLEASHVALGAATGVNWGVVVIISEVGMLVEGTFCPTVVPFMTIRTSQASASPRATNAANPNNHINQLGIFFTVTTFFSNQAPELAQGLCGP